MDYEKLTSKLKEVSGSRTELSFSDLIMILGELPKEATFRGWWDNSGETPQSKAWCDAGYSISKVIPDAYVQFVKNENNFNSSITSTRIELTNLKSVKKEITSDLTQGANEHNYSTSKAINNPSFDSIKKEMDSYWTPGANEHNNSSSKTIKNPSLDSVKKEMDSYWTPGGNQTMNKSEVSDNKMNVKNKKEESSKACVTLGFIFLILDFAIGIPTLIHFLNESLSGSVFAIIVMGVIFLILGIIFISAGSQESLGTLPSGNNYNSKDSLYFELQDHNRRVEQLMMENENRRLQENSYRQMHESEGSLADKFDTRLTNIFKNPWDGIL